MAELVGGTFVTKKNNTKSAVWQYFGLRSTKAGVIVEKEQDKPVCRTCGRSVHAKGSNTTNLFQHLREHHPLVYAEVAPQTSKQCSSVQASLSDIVAKSSKYSSSSAQAKELNRAVTYFLAKDGVPLSTVDKPGFRNMVTKLNLRYQLPSRRHFSDHEIPQLYAHVRDNVVMPVLREAECFSATTDLWTSAARESYMTFTVHFIDQNWHLQSFCLDTVPLFADHTRQNIADAILDILDKW